MKPEQDWEESRIGAGTPPAEVVGFYFTMV
jgi:hypothetical protein